MCVAIPPLPSRGGGGKGVGRDRTETEKYQIFQTSTIYGERNPKFGNINGSQT